jgi:hypothetical protein
MDKLEAFEDKILKMLQQKGVARLLAFIGGCAGVAAVVKPEWAWPKWVAAAGMTFGLWGNVHRE